jgi:simple sugar transport system ATP-binding protein
MNDTVDTPHTADLLVVDAVSKRFDATQALDGVSVTIVAGETVGLLGRNGAGKSTLVAALTGLIDIDSGEILIDGHRLGDDSSRGVISCLYQHSTLIPSLSVTENLFIDRIGNTAGGFIDWGRAHTAARTALLDWGVNLDPRIRVEELTLEERQSIELARALSRGSRLIILDEPTAQLDSHQAARLHERIRQLQDRGVSFLYISHFLPEVFEVCDRAVVFRDGRTVLTGSVAELDEPTIIRAMSGTTDGAVAQHTRGDVALAGSSEPVLRVEGLAVDGAFEPLSFDARPGQVVGLAGSLRSGATEVGRVLAGLVTPTSGTVSVAGKPVRLGSVRRVLEAGISSVPQDRLREGLFPQLGVDENVTATTTGLLGRFGFVSPRRRAVAADRVIEDFAVKTATRDAPIGSLSGGNQQKALFGRAFESNPAVLILDTPTAGVDIVSTAAIFDRLEEASTRGLATVIASNTLTELRACDIVHVMFEGRVIRTFDAGWSSEDMIAAIEGVTES